MKGVLAPQGLFRNCAVFAGNAGLANSILFGHTQGAFTGAVKKRDGAFTSANGGTLFLDELGELPLEVQAKFLRVIDDGEVIPEGADKPERKVSVRLLAATNRDISDMIRKGHFRADLFHRLTTLRVVVPPLRERKEDIDAIAARTLSELPRSWPSSQVDLERVRRAALLRLARKRPPAQQGSQAGDFMDMPIEEVLAEEKALGTLVFQQTSAPGGDTLTPQDAEAIRPMEEVRRAYARKAFELYHGNWTATAKALGVAQNTLRALLAKA